MGMRHGWETPRLVWSRPPGEPAESSDEVSVQALVEEWEAEVVILHRRRRFRLIHGALDDQPVSVR
jgi:hypothetical protein